MDKIKHSLCFSCCFHRNDVEPLAQEYQSLRSQDHPSRNKAKPAEIPQKNIKKNSSTFVSVVCKRYRQRRKRRRRKGRNSVGDFKYDPLSYSLNFDDGPDNDDYDASNGMYNNRYRSFSSRLPASPPAPTSPIITKSSSMVV